MFSVFLLLCLFVLLLFLGYFLKNNNNFKYTTLCMFVTSGFCNNNFGNSIYIYICMYVGVDHTYIDVNALAQGIKSFLVSQVGPQLLVSHANHSATETSICMYVCMHACMHVCMYIYTHTNIHRNTYHIFSNGYFNI